MVAITAVGAALSKVNDAVSKTQCGGDEQLEELVTELTWMQCFLVDSDKTAKGQVRSDVWSSAIERLAVGALELQYGCGSLSKDIAYINQRFASLRAKIKPFIVTDSVSSIQIPKEIKVAAWGGAGGNNWYFKPKGMIKQITIVHGAVIDSLTFTSVSEDGSDEETPLKVGGLGGNTTIQVNINGPSESLIGISGTIGDYQDYSDVISSLAFHTNVNKYGPYGTYNSGKPFSFVMEDGSKIVGFHGRYDKYVGAIGAYVVNSSM